MMLSILPESQAPKAARFLVGRSQHASKAEASIEFSNMLPFLIDMLLCVKSP
jgi:hypothetical protein